MEKYLLRRVLFAFTLYYLPTYSQDDGNNEMTDSIQINNSLINHYATMGQYWKAYQIALKNVDIYKSWGENSVPYAISLLEMAKKVIWKEN